MPKRPKAYLVTKDAQKREYDQKYYNLSVGERQGEVTLKEIDEKGRRVLIQYQGEDKWLTMKDNGVPAPTGPIPTNNFPGNPRPEHPFTPPTVAPLPLPGATTASAASTHLLNSPAFNKRRIPRNTGYGVAGISATGYGYSATPNSVAGGVSTSNVSLGPLTVTEENPNNQSFPVQNPPSTPLTSSIPVPPLPQP